MSNTTSQPLITKLAVLQQSEYEWPRFWEWLQSQTTTQEIAPKQWTVKLQTIATATRLLGPLFGENLVLQALTTSIAFPQQLYFNWVISQATAKLRSHQQRGLKVVCIAGSYAKTSTKYIANHLLSGSLNVLMTPENINTPIGIARLILRELNSDHQVFLAELGEYYPGDIAALTRFLDPDIKILTPIGFAHLERFKTQERLEQGLLELLTTPPKAAAIVNEANHGLVEKYGVDAANVTYVGSPNISHVDISRSGTEYDVNIAGDTLHAYIPLLGVHNALNTLPGIILAKLLGLESKTIAGRLRTLPPIPHRLEPTVLENNVLLLDNGYNSNPAAAEESLQVIAILEGSQKIVITPGFVELGSEQDAQNESLGKRLAKVADLVGIVTGANDPALLSGLKQMHYPDTQIICGKSEAEIMNLLQGKVQPNAVILFENSLPEVYKH